MVSIFSLSKLVINRDIFIKTKYKVAKCQKVMYNGFYADYKFVLFVKEKPIYENDEKMFLYSNVIISFKIDVKTTRNNTKPILVISK